MRVLLDEHLPRRLVGELPGHEAQTVESQGWKGLKNGPLLRLAADSGFDVFLSSDRGLEFQQNLDKIGLGIVVVQAPSNAIEDLRRLLPQALKAIESVNPGEIKLVAV